jgi:hypothetical protein
MFSGRRLVGQPELVSGLGIFGLHESPNVVAA